MRDLEQAKALLSSDAGTPAFSAATAKPMPSAAGVAPMVDLLWSRLDLAGFSAADKVGRTGLRALFSFFPVSGPYMPCVSEGAVRLFPGTGSALCAIR